MDGVKVYLANASRSLEGAIRSRNELLVFYNISRYQVTDYYYKMALLHFMGRTSAVSEFLNISMMLEDH